MTEKDIEALIDQGVKKLDRVSESCARDEARVKEIVEETKKNIRSLIELTDNARKLPLSALVLAVGEARIGGHPQNYVYPFETKYPKVEIGGSSIHLACVRGPEIVKEPGLYRFVLTIEKIDS